MRNEYFLRFQNVRQSPPQENTKKLKFEIRFSNHTLVKMDPCVICLEKQPTVKHPIELHCQCDVHFHTDCWNTYVKYKGHIECPLCHTHFVTNPLQEVQSKLYVEHDTAVKKLIVPYCLCTSSWFIGIAVIGCIFG